MSSRIRMDGAGPGDDPPAPPVEQPTAPQPELPLQTPQPEADPAPAVEPAEGDEPPKAADPDEIKRRIDRLTREKYESQRRFDELQRQFNEFQARSQPQAPQDPAREAEQRGYQRAQFERVEADFNARCNDIYHKGREEFGQEMDDAVAALTAAGWNGNRPDALAALTQLPDAHKVYHHLASDLDNAARVLALPPMQMAMELTRLAGDPATLGERAPASGDTTRAPPPIRPVGGNSGRRALSSDDPRLSMADFIRLRDREERRSRILR
jgi:hypothetical protein